MTEQLKQMRLSPHQKVFYFEWLLNPSSNRFHIVFDQKLYGDIDPERLSKALSRYVKDHLILNSHIQLNEDEPYWVTNESGRALVYIDHPVSDEELYAEASRPFHLYEEPLYRFILCRLAPNVYRFILVFHHILLHPSSFDTVIVRQISAYYDDPCHTFAYSLSQQQELIEKSDQELWLDLENNRERHTAFCNQLLANLEPIDLRFLQAQNQSDSEVNSMGKIEFYFSEKVLNNLERLCRHYAISSYTYSCCIFAIVLHKFTGQDSFALSYSIAIKKALDFVYGAQLNSFLFPFHFEKGQSIKSVFEHAKSFIQSVKQDTINYARYPIPDLIKEGRRNLLDVSLIQTNFKDTPFTFEGIEKVEVLNQFDMDLAVTLSFEQEIKNNQINFLVKYESAQVNKTLLENFVGCYQRIFKEVLNDFIHAKEQASQRSIASYALLDDKQYQQIILDWNQANQAFPDKTIADLFEAQVVKTPDRVALVFEEKKFTYHQLNTRANQLANYLKTTHQILPDTLIALCLDRNEHMLIGVLAVLKAGGAYVPIDPYLPDSRVAYMMEDTHGKALITNKRHHARLGKLCSDVIPIDSDDARVMLDTQLTTNPDRITGGRDLAYVIYTSGTTGNPKGVMLENRSIINTVYSLNHVYDLTLGQKITAFTSYAFDVSVSEFFTALLRGGELHLFSDVVRGDPEAVGAYLLKNDIDYTFLAPVTLSYLPKIHYPKLKGMVYAGEPCDKKTGLYWSQHVKLYNYYGPTETAIYALGKQVTDGDVHLIGKPLSNTQAYVFNSDLVPLPVGAIGELYIGGAGLARGYLNKPELTSKKFITYSFSSERQTRLYKTGDLVRWSPKGELEYLGRADFQVKIRGFRIELSEIESCLNHFPGVTQSVVILHQFENSNRPYLVGYYVSSNHLNEDKIFFHLREHLPDYMVPVFLVQLSEIPLTVNGKTDKKALPKPAMRDNQYYVPPETELEEQLACIWSAILDVPKERVGVADSFFKLGGNSLLIVKLKNQLHQISLFKTLTLADLFKYPTIQQLTQKFSADPHHFSEPIKIKQSVVTHDRDIAVIGMSGAFSGGTDLDHYWDLIQSGKEGIQRFEFEECQRVGMPEGLLQNPDFVPSSGHIPDIDKFDAPFWGMSPNEAKNLDPQIRLFLEHCWYALENSAYLSVRQQFNVGVFAAAGTQKYCISSSVFPLSSKDTLATQVSYSLGLTGPATNIHTACSSSLVTVIEACKTLAAGYCDLALAGGVALLMPKERGYLYQEGSVWTRDGHCHVFDTQSTGTVPGSGVGVVLLKRLSDAERDGDRIIGVIQGYATNNDGNRKINYTAPSVIGQKECIVNAQEMAGISSEMIDYVECHGTGTKLGDPVEILALNEAFEYNSNSSRQSSCILGSVKANVGHTDTASGIAGLLKVCKMLERKIIPPQINYSHPNPELHLSDTPFSISTEAKVWEKVSEKPRIAAVSSFGVGGTNAHVIISGPSDDVRSSNRDIGNFSRQKFTKQSYWLDSTPNVPTMSSNPVEDMFYKREWKRVDRLVFNNAPSLTNQNVVIFASRNSQIEHELSEAVANAGAKVRLINLTEEKQLTEICRNWQLKINAPNRVVYFCSGDATENEAIVLHQLLSQVVSKVSWECEFVSISLNTYEVIGMEDLCAYPSISPSMVLPYQMENPFVKARHYDVLKTEKGLVSTLLSLLALIPGGGAHQFIYAVRNDYLWSPIYVKKTVHTPSKNLLASPGLTHLITGAMGGVGTALIEYFINNTEQITLILLGRRSEIQAANEITVLKGQAEKKQIKLVYLQCNIGSDQGYQTISNKLAELQITKIDLVFHAAGVAAKSGLEQKSENDIKEIVFPKIDGTMNLIRLAKKVEIGALVNFSSLLSVIPYAGNTEYAAANSFLDEISYRKFEGVGRVLTINLNQIVDRGMAHNFLQQHKSSQILNSNNIYSWNVPDMLNKLLAENENQILVSKQDIETELKSLSSNLYKLKEQQVNTQFPNVLLEESRCLIEQQIAALFFNILGVEKFSVHDSFFDLGGTSLDAIDLISQLKQMGISLNLADLVNDNSVHKISYAHENNLLNDETSKQIILPLAIHNSSNRNVFFIHPVGGTILLYLNIAIALPKQYNYYGIQNINISGKQLLKVDSFEKLSEIYVEEILKIQPEGEYILMGSSMGGTLAYEMAAQLTSLEKKVKLVAMFDSWATFSDRFHDKKMFSNIIKNQAEKYDHRFDRFEKSDLLIESGWQLMQLLLNYQVKKQSINLCLYKAEDLDEEYAANGIHDDNGWRQYTSSLVIETIPGTHIGIHFPPGSNKLISSLEKLLLNSLED